MWESHNVVAEGELPDSWKPAHHPQSYLPPRNPSRLPKALILRLPTVVTELGQENRKLPQQSPACAASVNVRMNYGNTRPGWLEKGKRSSHDFDVEYQERRGARRSPEHLRPFKRLSVPFPAPCPQKSVPLGSRQRVQLALG